MISVDFSFQTSKIEMCMSVTFWSESLFVIWLIPLSLNIWNDLMKLKHHEHCPLLMQKNRI